ncbi:MAG: hypothetical protein M1834_000737 [Cirrosporium novae-zelandiae]|nr:MAG: hypothetical protein M1834_000737 [Cirrosporium novae-zelandiae]
MAIITPKALSGNPEAINAFIDKYDVYVVAAAAVAAYALRKIKRTGVLWSGEHLFEKTVEGLDVLRKKGKQLVFVSNNSTKSRADYAKKLNALGIPATPDEFFGSAYSAAIYISRILTLPPTKQKVFVLGEAGIEAELASEGVSFIGGTDPSLRRDMTPADFQAIADGSALDPEVGLVLAGLDFHLSFLKLSLAYHYVTQKGAKFLATNLDVALPSAGALFPGAGAVMAPLIRLFGGEDPEQCGKPSQVMMQALEGKLHFNKERTCMVGDRLDTDMRFGIEGGLGTLLVLTGVAKREEFVTEGGEGTGEVVPEAYLEKIGDLSLVA